MSTISLNRKAAVRIRITASTVATATAIVATVSTVIGIALGAEILASVAATIGLASIYTLDKKGGAA